MFFGGVAAFKRGVIKHGREVRIFDARKVYARNKKVLHGRYIRKTKLRSIEHICHAPASDVSRRKSSVDAGYDSSMLASSRSSTQRAACCLVQMDSTGRMRRGMRTTARYHFCASESAQLKPCDNRIEKTQMDINGVFAGKLGNNPLFTILPEAAVDRKSVV